MWYGTSGLQLPCVVQALPPLHEQVEPEERQYE
jgi:hypothetical protein